MFPDCADIEESIEAYVIGALDDAELAATESHLVRCESCALRIETVRRSSHALALAAPLEVPSASLKTRVMAGALVLRAARAPSRPRRRLRAIAAALFVVGVGAMIWGAVAQYRVHALQQRNASLRAEVTATADRVTALDASLAEAWDRQRVLEGQSDYDTALFDVATQSDAERVQLAGTALAPSATAHYIWSGSRELGVLGAQQLPALTDGMTYRLTIVYSTRSENGGSFTVDEAGRGELVVRDMDRTNDSGRPRAFEVRLAPALGDASAAGELVLRGTVTE